MLTGCPGSLATLMAAQAARTKTGLVLVATETLTGLWVVAAAWTALFLAETQCVPRPPAGNPARTAPSAQVAALMAASKLPQSLLECPVSLLPQVYQMPLPLPSPSLQQSLLFKILQPAPCQWASILMLLLLLCLQLPQQIWQHSILASLLLRLSLECQQHILQPLQLSLLHNQPCHQLQPLLHSISHL